MILCVKINTSPMEKFPTNVIKKKRRIKHCKYLRYLTKFLLKRKILFKNRFQKRFYFRCLVSNAMKITESQTAPAFVYLLLAPRAQLYSVTDASNKSDFEKYE